MSNEHQGISTEQEGTFVKPLDHVLSELEKANKELEVMRGVATHLAARVRQLELELEKYVKEKEACKPQNDL